MAATKAECLHEDDDKKWICAETMDEVRDLIEEAKTIAGGPQKTLIVFDIDNTLLAMENG